MRRRIAYSILVVVVGIIPMPAFAAVSIREIMYDPAGTDTGREWVEVTNDGSSAVDLTGYKFFEANTNHGLSVVSGSATLAPGESAVIIEDQAKFLADWPSVSATLLKSSFSLSNTGESIALKDSSLNIVDSVTYDSSMGASGDDNSLHCSGGTCSAGVTNPGVSGQVSAPVVQNQNANAPSVSATSSAPAPAPVVVSGSNAPAPLGARITTTATVMAGAGSFFSGSAYSPTGSLLSSARYIWNFGDGATGEGQTVFHTYEYPGKYAVVLTVAANDSSGMVQARVEAVPAQIGMLSEPDGSVVLVNQSTQDLNVGLWSLTSGTSTFVIPKDTVVLGSQSVHISKQAALLSGQGATLRYPTGATAAVAPSPSIQATAVPLSLASVAAALTPKATISTGPMVMAAQESPTPAVIRSATIPAAPKSRVAGTSTMATSTHLAGVGLGYSSWALWESVVGLVVLIGVGVAASWYAHPHGPLVSETYPSVEEFEIV